EGDVHVAIDSFEQFDRFGRRRVRDGDDALRVELFVDGVGRLRALVVDPADDFRVGTPDVLARAPARRALGPEGDAELAGREIALGFEQRCDDLPTGLWRYRTLDDDEIARRQPRGDVPDDGFENRDV